MPPSALGQACTLAPAERSDNALRPASAAPAALTGAPALAADGGPCQGEASRVIDATGDEPVVLRPGPIASTDLGPG